MKRVAVWEPEMAQGVCLRRALRLAGHDVQVARDLAQIETIHSAHDDEVIIVAPDCDPIECPAAFHHPPSICLWTEVHDQCEQCPALKVPKPYAMGDLLALLS